MAMNHPPSFKYCQNAADVPKTEHWAIMVERTINIPGDERSHTHPGHGYPASTEYAWEYMSYLDEDAWKRDIASRVKSDGYSDRYIAMHVHPATVTTEVVVKVNID